MSDVLSAIQSTFQNSTSSSQFQESFVGFVSAVNWSESWLLLLLGAHLSLFCIASFTRHRPNVQISLFGMLMVLIYCAEYINTYAAANWPSFASQPYFDKYGVFISVVFSFPLVLVMVVLLVNFLLTVVDLLVLVKRRQLRQEQMRKSRQAGADSAQDKKTS